MKTADVGLVQELLPDGRVAVSTQRVGFMILVCGAMVVSIVGTILGEVDYGLVAMMLGYAYVGKLSQKWEETIPFKTKPAQTNQKVPTDAPVNTPEKSTP